MSDLGPEARSILNEGRGGDDPRPADRARLRRNIARVIAAGGAAGAASAAGLAAEGAAAAAAAGKGLSALLLVKVVGGILLAGAAGAGIWLAAAPLETSPPAAPSAAVANSAVAALPAPSSAAAERPSPEQPAAASPAEPAAPEALPAAPTAKPATPVKASAAAATKAPEDPLEDETRRLREAHGALQSGDPEKALHLLDEQSAAYAGGQLREERAAARVLTLCKLGKVDEARAAAAAFLRDNPRSPLSDRVRGGCPAAPSP